jgi:hypothetical protein
MLITVKCVECKKLITLEVDEGEHNMHEELNNARGELELARRERSIAVMEANRNERRLNVACQMMAGILANKKLTGDYVSDEDGLVRLSYRIADKMIKGNTTCS